MSTSAAPQLRAEQAPAPEPPTRVLALAPESLRRSDPRGFDPTYGRQIGSVPYDDPTAGVRIGSHPDDDPTAGTQIGSHLYDDPTHGVTIGSHPYEDPTQGRKLGSDPYDDPTRGAPSENTASQSSV